MMNTFFDWFEHVYPYTNFHELNLDWCINTVKMLAETMKEFVTLNTIKYADPIQWNITKQYEKNTVVVEPLSGTAYISTQAVPSGVGINNTDYWSVVFTLDVISANKNITLRDDANNMLATFESFIGDWLLWNGTLYVVTRDIEIGQAYTIDYNIERATVELFIKKYLEDLADEINGVIGDLDNLTTTNKESVVNAINELVLSLGSVVTSLGDLDDLTTTDKDTIVNAINELVISLGNVSTSIGDLDDLETTEKGNIVNAVNEVVDDLSDFKDETTALTNINYINAVDHTIENLAHMSTNDTDNSSALNDLIQYCIVNHMGLYIPYGIYKVEQPIIVNGPINILGAGSYGQNYANISQFWGTTLKRTGSETGEIIKISNFTNGSISKINLDCNSTANIGLLIAGAQYSEFSHISVTNSLVAGFSLKTQNSIIAWCTFKNLTFISATGIGFDIGVDNGFIKSSNVCHCIFINSAINHGSGYGIKLGDADNNTFLNTYIWCSNSTIDSVFFDANNPVSPIGNIFILLEAQNGLNNNNISWNSVFMYAYDNGEKGVTGNGVTPLIGDTYGRLGDIGGIAGRFAKEGNVLRSTHTFPANANSSHVSFDNPEPDNNYLVFLQTAAGSAIGSVFNYANASANGFDIFTSTPPSTNVHINYLIIR